MASIQTLSAHVRNSVWALVKLTGLAIAATQTLSAGPPSVESVWPPAGKVGEPFTVVVEGANLQTVYAVQFYSPHVRCTDIKHVSDYKLELQVETDPHCPLTNMPFRVLGRDGYSELLTVRTTSLPVVQLSAHAASDVEQADGQAPAVQLDRSNVTICNVAKSSGMDRYVLNLQAGQRITAEVEAIRLGHELLDMVITAIGPDDQVVVQVDDTPLFGQDPLVSFTAAESGDYTFLVHEANYRGGEGSHYLLHLGDFPPPSVVYPAGGPAGSSVAISFLTSDPSSQTQTVDLPQLDEVSGFQLFHRVNEHAGPTPVPFRLSAFPNVLEVETNDQPDRSYGKSVLIKDRAAPVAFNGILQQASDVDTFWFAASAATPVRIDVFADQIGAACDTLLTLLDANLEPIAFNDDWGSHDSRIDFYPPEDGNYCVVVTDKLGAGSPTSVYRIEVVPLEPALVAFLPRPNRMTQQSQSLSVPQGNRALVRLGVRRDVFDGDVGLLLSDLPTGVHASPALVPSDQYWVPMVVEATSDAEQQGTFARVAASGKIDGRDVTGGFEQVVDLVAESADRLFTGAHVDRLPVMVAAPVPFTIDLVEPTISLPRGGALDIRINVTRQAGFIEPVRVEFPCLPAWVVGEAFVVIPGDRDHITYRLDARPEAAIRNWPFVATARVDTLSATGDTTTLNGREVASQIVTLSVQDAPMAGTMDVIAAEQGTTIDVVCNFTQSGVLPESMRVELEGLPNRIVANATQVGRADELAAFSLELAEDAPLGEFKGIQCRFSGELDGQQVSFAVARDTKLLVTPRGKLFRNESGELLSPLDALKAEKNR